MWGELRQHATYHEVSKLFKWESLCNFGLRWLFVLIITCLVHKLVRYVHPNFPESNVIHSSHLKVWSQWFDNWLLITYQISFLLVNIMRQTRYKVIFWSEIVDLTLLQTRWCWKDMILFCRDGWWSFIPVKLFTPGSKHYYTSTTVLQNSTIQENISKWNVLMMLL